MAVCKNYFSLNTESSSWHRPQYRKERSSGQYWMGASNQARNDHPVLNRV